MHNTLVKAPLIISLAFLAGCVSNRSQKSFEQVEEEVGRRTGQAIRWHQVPEEREEARKQKNILLEDELRLQEAVKITLLNNPSLQRLYQSIGIAEAEVVKTMLPPNPVMEIGYTHIRSNGHSWEFNLVQELIGVIMIPWNKKVAEAEAQRVRYKITAEVMDIVLNVKIAYRRAQAAKQTLEMLKKTLQSDQAAYEMAERLRDAGNISKLELKGHKAVLEQTKMDVSNAGLKFAEKRERLNLLLGLNHERSQWTISDPLPEMKQEDQPPAAEYITAAAQQNSLELEMAQTALLRASRQRGITTFTSVMPSMEAEMQSERESGGTWRLGPLLAFPLPLFDWGQTERTIADAEINRAIEYIKEIRIQLGAASRITAQRLKTRREQVIQYENTIIPLKKDLTEETQRHFNAMEVGVFDLLAAKKKELDAKRDYLEALADYWVARAETNHLMSGRIPAAGTVRVEHNR